MTENSNNEQFSFPVKEAMGLFSVIDRYFPVVILNGKRSEHSMSVDENGNLIVCINVLCFKTSKIKHINILSDDSNDQIDSSLLESYFLTLVNEGVLSRNYSDLVSKHNEKEKEITKELDNLFRGGNDVNTNTI